MNPDGGHISSPNYPQRYERGAFCQWLLQAPEPWQRIELEVGEVDLEHEDVVPPDTCHDRLFIRPHGTDVVTKSVSCLPSHTDALRGSRHRSQRPWLLVEFRSFHWGSHEHRGFNLSYRLVGAPPARPHRPALVSDAGQTPAVPARLYCYACYSMQECNTTRLESALCGDDEACGRTVNELGAVEWRGCLSVGKCRRAKRHCRSGTACVSCCMRGYCNAAPSLQLLRPLLLLALAAFLLPFPR